MNAPPSQNTRFTRHGPVRVALGGTHLQHADGTPFFYLADTAWNGALLSSECEWADYLADRAAKGFTAIQFVLTAPWLAASSDEQGEEAYVSEVTVGPFEDHVLNPRFFERMDERVAAINDAGLLAVPVLAWAADSGPWRKMNPGAWMGRHLLQGLLRQLVDRYHACEILWLLAGDGRYGGLRSWRWKRIGRAVFAGHRHPVALHPMGLTWPYRNFRREPWLNVVGYQSSHSDSPKTLRWLLAGPPAQQWQTLRKPFINLEPCYEGIRNWNGTTAVTDRDVRRAIYVSLLNAPTAGVTYGAHGVWSWERTPREPLNHIGTGIARPWRHALDLPGSHDVHRLATLFTSLEWWRLRPAPDLLTAQPAPNDWSGYISCSATDTLNLALCYLPNGGTVTLTRTPAQAEWFDPRTGSRLPASSTRTLNAPSADDWILLLRNLE